MLTNRLLMRQVEGGTPMAQTPLEWVHEEWDSHQDNHHHAGYTGVDQRAQTEGWPMFDEVSEEDTGGEVSGGYKVYCANFEEHEVLTTLEKFAATRTNGPMQLLMEFMRFLNENTDTFDPVMVSIFLDTNEPLKLTEAQMVELANGYLQDGGATGVRNRG